MKAIDFVVRNEAGAIQRGVVPPEGLETVVTLSGGLKVSLNVEPGDIASHQRQGNDLVLTMADGRVVRLEEFFDETASPNQLYLSTDGTLSDVLYVQSDEGELIAQYGPAEQWGRWSAADDLIFLGPTQVTAADSDFETNVSRVASELFGESDLFTPGGAVVAGGVALGYLSGGDTEDVSSSSSTGERARAVSEGAASAQLSQTSSAGEGEAAFEVSSSKAGGADLVVAGIAEPGATVTLRLGEAGTSAVTDSDGNWSATFSGGAIEDGTYEAILSATAIDLDGNARTITQPVTVDTEALVLMIDGPVAGDGSKNGTEAADGIMLSGAAAPGALVSVTMAGISHEVVAQENGTWQAYFAAGEVAPGVYTADISAMTTDATGNTNIVADTVQVDTRVELLALSSAVPSDADQSAGITLSGQVEPGSSIVVDFAGVSLDAEVNESGNWSLGVPPEYIESGDYMASIVVTATDPAGNTDTLSSTLHIDTNSPEGPVIDSFAEVGTDLGKYNVAAVDMQDSASLAIVDAQLTGSTEGASDVLHTLETGSLLLDEDLQTGGVI